MFLCPVAMHLGDGLTSMAAGSVVGAPEQGGERKVLCWVGACLQLLLGQWDPFGEWPRNMGHLGSATGVGGVEILAFVLPCHGQPEQANHDANEADRKMGNNWTNYALL